MAVNAKGVFLGTKHAIPAMRRAGGGSIVNISSVAGIGQSLHQEPAYAASKGAIRIFTKVTASQHAKDGIRCNSVHPGPVDTEMFHSAFRDRDAMQRRLERVPLRRMGTVAEIVSAVLYLASDESSYMSGQRAGHRRRRAGAVIKVVVLLRRPADAGRASASTAGGSTSTSRYAKMLPDLRKYRVCLVTGSTSHAGREPWDGIAELWFDDRAALDAAWSSEVGQTALAHSRDSHSDRLVLITEEHELIG